MRPKKRVLIFSAEELGAMPIRFVLQTRGYLPMLAHTIDEYAAALDQLSPDLVLILFRGTNEDLAIRADQLAVGHGLQVVVALMGKTHVWRGIAHAIVKERNAGFVMELVEYLRIFAARKRGPKKADSASTLAQIAAGRSAAAANERALA